MLPFRHWIVKDSDQSEAVRQPAISKDRSWPTVARRGLAALGLERKYQILLRGRTSTSVVVQSVAHGLQFVKNLLPVVRPAVEHQR